VPKPFSRAEYDHLPEVLTSVEVARILDSTEVQVCRWAAQGRVPGIQIGRMWRFSKTSIEQLISGGNLPR
jgi:excisionase family DNA binding protein